MIIIFDLLILFLALIVSPIAAWFFKLLYHRLEQLDLASKATYGVSLAGPDTIVVWCLLFLLIVPGGLLFWLTLPLFSLGCFLFTRRLIKRTSPHMAREATLVYFGLGLCALTIVGAIGGIIAANYARRNELDRRLIALRRNADNAAMYRL